VLHPYRNAADFAADLVTRSLAAQPPSGQIAVLTSRPT
jgi:hypothetical protein